LFPTIYHVFAAPESTKWIAKAKNLPPLRSLMPSAKSARESSFFTSFLFFFFPRPTHPEPPTHKKNWVQTGRLSPPLSPFMQGRPEFWASTHEVAP
jgi:hypothetical protein